MVGNYERKMHKVNYGIIVNKKLRSKLIGGDL
jgi:hypothetical protein